MPSTGPLFKFVLFQTWVDEFYLFACFHHIIIDGNRNYAYSPIGLQRSTPQLFLAHPFPLLS